MKKKISILILSLLLIISSFFILIPNTSAVDIPCEYTYTAWQPETCNAGDIQNRTITQIAPFNCTTGTPVTSRNCVYAQYHVITGIAKNITDSEATLTGSVNPKGNLSSGYFRYSPVAPGDISPIFCNEVFGDDMKSTNEVNVGQGTTPQSFYTAVVGLDPNTTYYYCAVGSSKDTIEYGSLAHFTTANDPGTLLASIETKPATQITSDSATLNGFYNTSVPSQTWFEYKKKKTFADIKNDTVEQMQSKPSISGLFSSFSNINNVYNAPANNLTLSNSNTSANNFNQISNQAPNFNVSMPSSSSFLNTVSNNNTPANYIYTTNPATATTYSNNTTNTDPYAWKKVSNQSHEANKSSGIKYTLTGLAKGVTYEFRAVSQIKVNNGAPQISYGDTLSFVTKNSGTSNEPTDDYDDNTNNDTPLTLGQITAPPVDTIVRYHEGVEHVFVRQIMVNLELAKLYGYKEGSNLENFAWWLADFFARTFGYVGQDGKEIRVSYPDRAAYQLKLEGTKLTVYEYFDSKIISIQNITSALKGKYYYEYYFQK